ncbi:transposase, partial [Escherichia coli]|nr:transposase [Escherichia coli]
GEKRILYGQSAHHFFFSSSTIHVSLPRLITDYEMQKYLSFQLPVIRYRERFWQYME